MFEDIIPLLKKKARFLVTSHINPEGDSTGSVFAIADILERLGSDVEIVCQDNIPNDLLFLNKKWKLSKDIQSELNYDWVIAVDVPSLERVGDVIQYIKGDNIIVIDHHISCKKFGKYNIVDEKASSCGEMLFRLLEELELEITEEFAKYVYIAIVTDSGSFMYSNTGAYTHYVAGALIDAGLNVAEINSKLFNEQPLMKLKFVARFLENSKFVNNNRLAYSVLRQEDFISLSAKKNYTDGFVNMLLSVKGVEVAFFLTETEDSKVKVSFRSKGNIDVNTLANLSGGGGHKKAAGATFSTTNIESVVNSILERISLN